MTKFWSDQDILIIKNQRVLNKKISQKFYKIYRDKFIEEIDIDKQLFTEEWALKVVERYPIDDIDIQLAINDFNEIFNNKTFTQNDFIKYIFDLPNTLGIKKVQKIKEIGIIIADNYPQLNMNDNIFQTCMNENVMKTNIKFLTTEQIFNERIKKLNDLYIYLKLIKNEDYDKDLIVDKVLDLLESRGYFNTPGTKAIELGNFLNILNGDCFAFNRIIDRICDKYSVIDLQLKIKDCLKGNIFVVSNNELEQYITTFLKTNAYKPSRGIFYLDSLVYKVYNKFPNESDEQIKAVLTKYLVGNYDYSIVNIEIAIIMYKKNKTIPKKYDMLGNQQYIKDFIYNNPEGIEQGLINSYIHLNDDNWKNVVRGLLQKINILYKRVTTSQKVSEEEVNLLANLLIGIRSYSRGSESSFYHIVLSLLNLNDKKYESLILELTNKKWLPINNDIEQLILDDIYYRNYNAINEYLENDKYRSIIRTNKFSKRMGMSYDKLCYLTIENYYKDLLNIPAKNISYEQLVEFYVNVFYKTEEELEDYCNYLAYFRIKGIHDLVKDNPLYPTKRVEVILDRMDKTKELEVDRIFRIKKPSTPLEKQKVAYGIMTGAGIISFIGMSLFKNPIEVVNEASGLLTNYFSNSVGNINTDETFRDISLYLLSISATFFGSMKNIKINKELKKK